MAMAAPTPISALVHSSTLVTSGLYLIIRYSFLIYSFNGSTKVLAFLRIFTSFYAGLNSLVETDIKKLIALSTLSHLGFIRLTFSLGLLNLRFFHLLVHALFKSLLFMSMGDIMINLSHSQDIRYLSRGFCYTPVSSFFKSLASVNLLGLPSLRGFFSKDLILETFFFTNSSYVLVILLYLNVILTFSYTYKLISFRFQSIKLSSFLSFHKVSVLHICLLLVLTFSRLIFGVLFLSTVLETTFYLTTPLTIKLVPLLFNSFLFLVLAI